MNDELELAVKILNESPLPPEIRELAIKRLGELNVFWVEENYRASQIIGNNLISWDSLEGVNFWGEVRRVLIEKRDGSEWPVIPKPSIPIISKGELFPDYHVFWHKDRQRFSAANYLVSVPEAKEILEASIKLYEIRTQTGLKMLSTSLGDIVIAAFEDNKINIGCQETTLDKIQAALEKIKTFI